MVFIEYEDSCTVCEKIYTKEHHAQKYCCKQCQQQGCEWARYKYEQKTNKVSYCSLRFKVLARDNFTCQYCGRTPQDGIKLEVDHIYPKSKGGKLEINNLITACETCNVGKCDVILGERLLRKLREHAEHKVINYQYE